MLLSKDDELQSTSKLLKSKVHIMMICCYCLIIHVCDVIVLARGSQTVGERGDNNEDHYSTNGVSSLNITTHVTVIIMYVDHL